MTLKDKTQDGIRWIGEPNCDFILVSDIAQAIKELKERIEDAQEDYGNLDWVSKEQAIKIIDKIFGDFKETTK